MRLNPTSSSVVSAAVTFSIACRAAGVSFSLRMTPTMLPTVCSPRSSSRATSSLPADVVGAVDAGAPAPVTVWSDEPQPARTRASRVMVSAVRGARIATASCVPQPCRVCACPAGRCPQPQPGPSGRGTGTARRPGVRRRWTAEPATPDVRRERGGGHHLDGSGWSAAGVPRTAPARRPSPGCRSRPAWRRAAPVRRTWAPRGRRWKTPPTRPPPRRVCPSRNVHRQGDHGREGHGRRRHLHVLKGAGGHAVGAGPVRPVEQPGGGVADQAHRRPPATRVQGVSSRSRPSRSRSAPSARATHRPVAVKISAWYRLLFKPRS